MTVTWSKWQALKQREVIVFRVHLRTEQREETNEPDIGEELRQATRRFLGYWL